MKWTAEFAICRHAPDDFSTRISDYEVFAEHDIRGESLDIITQQVIDLILTNKTLHAPPDNERWHIQSNSITKHYSVLDVDMFYHYRLKLSLLDGSPIKINRPISTFPKHLKSPAKISNENDGSDDSLDRLLADMNALLNEKEMNDAVESRISDPEP